MWKEGTVFRELRLQISLTRMANYFLSGFNIRT